MKFAKLLRVPNLRNICKWLLLEVYYKKARSIKLCNIHRTKVASDICSVKKSCSWLELWKWRVLILINISCKKCNCPIELSWIFLVKNNCQGTENTKLPLLRNVKCFFVNFCKAMTPNYSSFVHCSWKSFFLQNILKCAEG